jgi:small subunit ribosomal protein S15
MLNKELKTKVIKEYATHKDDTGSSHVQIALITERVKQIAAHLKSFPKDYHSQRGLTMLVGQRRSLLNYLKRKDFSAYESLTKMIKG